MLTGEGRFDVSQSTHFTYPLRTEGAKSILIEFSPDGNGKCSGSVAVFLGQTVSGAPPWRTVSASSLRVYPSPETDFVTIVPSDGAFGICTVSLSTENLGVGIYPFSRGSSANAAAPYVIVAHDNITDTRGSSGIIPEMSLPIPIQTEATAFSVVFSGIYSEVGFSNYFGTFEPNSFINAAIFLDGFALEPYTAIPQGPFIIRKTVNIPADYDTHIISFQYEDQDSTNVGTVTFGPRTLSAMPVAA